MNPARFIVLSNHHRAPLMSGGLVYLMISVVSRYRGVST